MSNIPKDFITQWHPQLPKLPFILNEHKNTVTYSEDLSSCFPEPPKLMYWRERNLKDTLFKSDITTSSKDSNLEQNHPCNHGNCMLCSSFEKTNAIKISKTVEKLKSSMVDNAKQKTYMLQSVLNIRSCTSDRVKLK